MVKKGHFKKDNDKFDAVVSYSSLEHSGLGRYFDMINPWSDIITMAQVPTSKQMKLQVTNRVILI